MTILERVQQPTPNFFKKVRNFGLILGALGLSIVTAPMALPPLLVKIAGYLTVAGAVAGAVSQATTTPGSDPVKDDHHD